MILLTEQTKKLKKIKKDKDMLMDMKEFVIQNAPLKEITLEKDGRIITPQKTRINVFWRLIKMSYNNKTSLKVFGSICLLDLLFVVFVVLKLINVIDWSWWWVTAFFWGQFALTILVAIIFTIVRITFDIIVWVKQKKSNKGDRK